MECYSYPQFPAFVYIALYTNVCNCSLLRQRIIKAATYGEEGHLERDALNFAFIDASMITSPLHLQTAIYQAILTESQGCLRTKTVHSEVLWALNPTNNITEAFRRYGVSDTSTALFVVRIAPSGIQDIRNKMDSIVQGSIVPLSALGQLTAWTTIKKHHKLSAEADQATVDNIVVSSVAMKSVVA